MARRRNGGLAIERLLPILGEALMRVRNTDSAVFEQIGDAHGIIGMRNVIVYGYDALDPQRIQRAIDEGLLRFVAEVTQLLA